MLIVALVIVAVLYAGLYLLYEQMQGTFNQSTGFLVRIESLILFPRHVVFQLFYCLIALTLCYVIWDFFFSTAKRAKRRMDKAKKESAEAAKPVKPLPRR